LGRIGSAGAAAALVDSLKDEDPKTVGSAATALGRIGSEDAVGPLIDCLDDEASSVRGSAAYALGLIGSERAAVPLMEQCRREVQRQRWSYVTALGRIAANRVVPYLSAVVGTVLDELSGQPARRTDWAARALLRSAFRSGNLAMIREVVDLVRTRLPNGHDLSAPHRIALAYLESKRDPAIIERQHPEMRDAVALLVGAFDRAEDARTPAPAAVSS
jgi:HEAT repeat protein